MPRMNWVKRAEKETDLHMNQVKIKQLHDMFQVIWNSKSNNSKTYNL